MPGTVGFVMVLHNHQPVGNFDYVFEEAVAKCYAPFLEVLDRKTELPVTLHYSGCLLEWFESHRPEILTRLKELVSLGRVELLGGGMYEPIMTGLPRADALGQLEMMRSYLEERFRAHCRGAWLAERVWESSLAAVLAEAGIEYLALDDSHFRSAGLAPEELTRGPWLAEDEGKLVRIFPAEEKLRYLIPSAAPEEVIAHLRSVAERTPEGETSLCVYADDGEKFGVWPGTYDHVYGERWLERLFAALELARDWLRVMTLAEAADRYEPAGRVYLPDASYREMTEWALPAREIPVYERVVARAREEFGDFETLSRFIRAGQWKNFRAKYPEANRLYAKMLLVSEKVREAAAARPRDRRTAEARRALYRGQCNCPYWHGVFGGLYLPHLRSAAYAELIRAENLADEMRHEPAGRGSSAGRRSSSRSSGTRRAQGARTEWVERRVADLDLDGHQEILLANRHLSACFSPRRGGHLYELDLREKNFNVTDTLTRRYEAYHEELLRADGSGDSPDGSPASIHEGTPVKEAGLAGRLVYDSYLRESLIDHLFPGAVVPDPAELAAGRSVGDAFWLSGESECDLDESLFVPAGREKGKKAKKARKAGDRAVGAVGVRFIRSGRLGATEIRLVKTARLEAGERAITFGYLVESVARDCEVTLGVEFGLSLLAGSAPDRYYYSPEREKVGNLSTVERFGGLRSFGLRDEWQGIDLRLVFSREVDLCTYPVETISRSEGGVERVYQSSCVVPFFSLRLARGKLWEAEIRLEVRYG